MTEYTVLFPGGNLTAIVRTSVPKKKRPELAKRIMEQSPDIEQVGFVSASTAPDAAFRLDMMGEEFCVNAARCAALLWQRQHPAHREISFMVSGCKQPLTAEITGSRVTLRLPLTLILNSQSVESGKLIDLGGIRFLVSEQPLGAEKLLEIAKQQGESIPAVGLIEISEREEESFAISALVWVRETDTLIQETACGSGSIAACVYCRELQPENKKFSVKQPSGHAYEVSFETDSDGSISIAGAVSFISDGGRIE